MKYNYKDLTFELIYNYKPQNKHAYIRVKDGIVIINSFKRFNEADINKVLNELYSNIKAHLNSLKLKENKKPIIHYLGNEYIINIKEDSYNLVEIKDDTNILIHTKKLDNKYIKKIIDLFYIDALDIYIKQNYSNLLLSFPEIKNIPTFEFKNITSAYGKYNKKTNKITISIKMAKYHPFYIKLVLAHELTHYIYMNHQSEFYLKLESVIPNAKRYQHSLRKIKYDDYF